MTTRYCAIGIDPGKSGAIAILTPIHPPYIIRGDDTERDVWNKLTVFINCLELDLIKRASLERVSAMPKQGVSSTFKFGQSYGFLRGILIASELPFEEVQPAKWQQELSCRTKGDKNITKAKAQQLFPEIKVTHRNADALLIAEYCRRTMF